MKKALLMLGALLVVAASVIFTRQRVGGRVGEFPVSRAAELAPPETVAYLEVADLDRALLNWEQSEFGAIAKDPGVPLLSWQIFRYDIALKFLGDSDLTSAVLRLLAEPRKEAPAGIFLAATDLAAEPYTKVVGGLPYRGKKSDVENSVRALKKLLEGVWTGFKSELSSHRGIQIETLTGAATFSTTPAYRRFPPPDISVQETRGPFPFTGPNRVWVMRSFAPPPPVPAAALHLAYRDDWLFFATDRALLTGALDRYLGEGSVGKRLAEDSDYLECRKHGVPEADLILWLRWKPAGQQYAEDRLPRQFAKWDDSKNPRRALHYSLRFDGAVRERRYLQLSHPPETLPAIDDANTRRRRDANPFHRDFADFEPGAFAATYLDSRIGPVVVTAIAKHLSPGTIRAVPEGPGWVQESTLSIPARYLFDLHFESLQNEKRSPVLDEYLKYRQDAP